MSIILAIGIGVAAGIIDIIPMVLQKLDKYATLSAFVHWVVLGIVITHMHIGGLEGWLKGLVVAVLLTLPILIIVAKDDKKIDSADPGYDGYSREPGRPGRRIPEHLIFLLFINRTGLFYTDIREHFHCLLFDIRSILKRFACRRNPL